MTEIRRDPEYFSLVYYFPAPPEKIAAIIKACLAESVKLLGPIRPYLGWGLGRHLMKDRRRVIRYRLDDPALIKGFQKWASDGLNLILPIPAARRKKSLDFIWHLSYEPISISHVRFEPTLGIHMGLPFLSPDQAVRLAHFCESLSEAIVRHSRICYGLADVDPARYTGYGKIYQSTIPGCVPLDRQTRRRVWLRLGARRKRTLRGVFWGQVLPPSMVRKLGGSRRFIEEYRALEDPVERNLARRFDDGSIFVRVSNSPLDVRPSSYYLSPPSLGYMPTTIDRAVWLYERFQAAGLL